MNAVGIHVSRYVPILQAVIIATVAVDI